MTKYLTNNGLYSTNGNKSDKVLTLNGNFQTIEDLPVSEKLITDSGNPLNYVEPTINTSLRIKVWLQGAYNTSTNVMTTNLNSSNYLPLSQPYNTSPFNYSGTESVGSIPNANITDWILVELREQYNNTIISRRAGFILKTGYIVDIDGSSDLLFENISQLKYNIVIRHRNHLAVMVSNPIWFTTDLIEYDFSTGLDKYYGGDAKLSEAGVYSMYGGDVNQDGRIDKSIGFDISNCDYNYDMDIVYRDTGQIGYKTSDITLNTVVNASDRGFVLAQINKTSKVPNLNQ